MRQADRAGRERAGPPVPTRRRSLAFDKARDKLISLVEKKCNDTQVLDAALKFGGECGDDRARRAGRGVPVHDVRAQRRRRQRDPAAHAALALSRRDDRGAGATRASAAVNALSDLGDFSYGVAAGDATDTAFIAWTRTSATPPSRSRWRPTRLHARCADHPGLIPEPGARQHDQGRGDGSHRLDAVLLSLHGRPADTSRTGRIRTAPVAASTAPFTFAFTGDSNAFFKPYSVLEGITRDDPDLFLYIGDTIYCDDTRSGTGEAMVLADYHVKYDENRDDRALRDVMANVGTDTIWDDHEVTNDFYGSPFGAFGPQIVAGNQAFRDWMPMREDTGDPMQLYRSFKWGDVAEFFLTDDRQYRSPQAYVTEPACLSAGEPAVLPPAGPCTTEINNPARTYLGAAQKAWLKAGLAASTAKWKFVMNGPLHHEPALPAVRPLGRLRGRAHRDARVHPQPRRQRDDRRSPDERRLPLHRHPRGDLQPDGRRIPARRLAASPRSSPAPSAWTRSTASCRPAILPFVGSLPALFPTIQFFDIDRRNYVLRRPRARRRRRSRIATTRARC